MDRITPLYELDRPIQLVGGGTVDTGLLGKNMPLFAADGGADIIVSAGYFPYAVIGDLDSLAAQDRLRAAGIPVHHIAEQESTDLEKCLLRIRAPLIIGNGFLGKRIDHTLSALSVLVRFPDRNLVLMGDGEIAFLWRDSFALEMEKGERISFFPFNPVCGIDCKGLTWPITGLDFAPNGMIGTLNKASGGVVRARFSAPMITIIGAHRLEAVTSLLSP